jgi:hypothetical protein
MSAAAPLPATEPLTEAVIDSASVGAGHDGEAELIVRLIHPNGAAETVTLDAELGFHLMNNCGVSDAAGLAGQPWRKILEGL